MSLDFYNILNMKEEKIVDHSAATALHAAMYIEEASSHFLEVGKLAKKFGLSRNRFTKVFTDYWQISPQEYLINYRISHAKNLLVNTAQTIGEIAARLGYSDHYFFARQFKAKTRDFLPAFSAKSAARKSTRINQKQRYVKTGDQDHEKQEPSNNPTVEQSNNGTSE